MRPLRLEMEGLASYRRPAVIDLRNVGILCITGPNGAGKSTITEAIQIALYGRPGRTRSIDSLISQGMETLRVAFEFFHDGNEWRVVRERVRGKRTNALLETLDGQEVARGVEAVDDALRRLIGVSREAFLTTALLAQGDAARFCESDPAKRKALLGELLGLDRFSILAEAAKLRRKEAEGSLSGARARVGELQDELKAKAAATADAVAGERDLHKMRESLQEAQKHVDAAKAATQTLSLLEDQLKVLDERERDRAAHAHTQLADARQHLEATKQVVARRKRALDAAVAEVERARQAGGSLGALRTKVNERHSEALALKQEEAETLDAGRRVRFTMDQAAAESSRMEKVVQEITERLELLEKHSETAECYVCGQPVRGEDRARLVEQLSEESKEAAARIAALRAKQEEASKKREQLKLALEKVKSSAAKNDKALEALKQELAKAELVAQGLRTAEQSQREAGSEADRALQEANEAEAAFKRAEEAMAGVAATDPRRKELVEQIETSRQAATGLPKAEERCKEVETRVHSLVAELGKLEERLRRYGELENKLETLQQDETDLYARVRRLLVLERAFGKDGVPLLVIEGALAELEADVADVLARLATSGFNVQLVTERMTASGTKSEALDIMVEADGIERPFELLSGGERIRLSLAISAALARLLGRRVQGGGGVDMLFFDEPSALDADGVRALVDWLWVMHEEVSCIAVVTHLDEIASAFDTRLVVDKGSDGSTVRMATP